MRTRTEITVETERWIVVKAQRTAWCATCRRRVDVLNVEDAGIPAQATPNFSHGNAAEAKAESS
jgi:hypothetical protein